MAQVTRSAVSGVAGPLFETLPILSILMGGVREASVTVTRPYNTALAPIHGMESTHAELMSLRSMGWRRSTIAMK